MEDREAAAPRDTGEDPAPSHGWRVGKHFPFLRKGEAPDEVMEGASLSGTEKQLERLLQAAFRHHATSVHLEPQEESLRVRFLGPDGVLYQFPLLPLGSYAELLGFLKGSLTEKVALLKGVREGSLALPLHGEVWEVRVVVVPTMRGEVVVLRPGLQDQPQQQRLLSLGFEAEDLLRLQQVLRGPPGLVLLAGPGGSGKSTTLRTLLSEPRAAGPAVWKAAPVQRVLALPASAQQPSEASGGEGRPVEARASLAGRFHSVDELRDEAAVRRAIDAARSGAPVLATIQAVDAADALGRLKGLGFSPFLAATLLRGVAAQCTVRRLCPHCSIEVDPRPEEQQRYAEVTGRSLEHVAVGMGCSQCNGTGYLGRVGVFEVVEVGERLRSAVAEGAGAESLRPLALAQGMAPLRRNGMRKVEASLTTLDEVLSTTPS
ncbi:MAG: Flp pilus assembly complex ATPase component TadA [Chloroflexi bacterium]|nr:Flp pilus assembly complex ATPase component TadA [Chloroflexota bacterium]